MQLSLLEKSSIFDLAKDCCSGRNNNQLTRFVIADGLSADLAELINGAKEPVFQIGSTDDPIELISKVLDRQRQEGQFVEELHLIAHGSQQGIHLGCQFIDANELKNNAVELGNWDLKRIVLWSCYIGGNSQWIERLEELTGAEVLSSQGQINREHTCVQSLQSNQKDFSEIIDQRFIERWEGSLPWQQVGSDIDGEAAHDWSGYSVSLSDDGSVVAIGGYLNDGNGGSSGHVRIYQNNSGTWQQIGSDIDGEAAYDQSGYSVSLSDDGSVVAIGGSRNDGNGIDSGHVRIYQNNSGTWQQIGSDIDGEVANDFSGYSVSLSSDGSVVAIGAFYNDGNGIDSGHVRIYQNNSGTWQQVGSDIDGEAASDRSGYSVSLSSDGSIVAIGAPYNDGTADASGHVRIYQNNGGTWQQIGSDIDGEAWADYSGSSVSLSDDGSIVAIGAWGNEGTDGSGDRGHVRIYQYSGGSWSQLGSDIDGEAKNDNSGYSVSLSDDGSIVAIGAQYNDGNGNKSGHVRIYQYSGGSWSQLGSDIDGEAANDYSGHAVSLSSDGSVVAIGAYGNDGNGNKSGHVRLFQNDFIAPTVSGVTSSTSNGTYKVGDVINISVAFSESVNVVTTGGTPTLELETGATDRTASYASGTGTSTLVFSYTVQAGDTSSDLDYKATSSLALNGGTIQDAAGNNATLTLASPGTSNSLGANKALVIDGVVPTLSSSSPVDNATAVAGNSNIVLNFSEAVDVESGNITIKKTSDNSTIETIAVGSGQVTGSGTTQITINPSVTLASGTEYYVQIAATAFDDAAGNSYAGITDTTSLSFTTADVISPTLSSNSPVDNATAVAVDSNIVLNFAEAVDAESGNILIKKTSDNSTIETIAVGSGQVTGSGTTQITINPSVTLASGTEYYVQIAAIAFDDAAGNSYAGITDTTSLSFTTADVISPTLSSSSPADNATAVAVDSNIVLNFAEAVDAESGNILIKKTSDNSTIETIAVGSGQVTGSGTTQITINPSVTLASGTEYYVQIAATAFDDAAGNSYAGITDTTNLSFRTVNASSTGSGDSSDPQIRGPSGSITSTSGINLIENTSFVYTFTANESVTWDVRGGDSDLFKIDSSTGALSFKTAPDFEDPKDNNKINSYSTIIYATDTAGNSSYQTITVGVSNTDINEINGTNSIDSLVSTASSENIDGGAGKDTVIFNGKFSDYSITRLDNALKIADQRSSNLDGTDTLKKIEYIQFSDQTVEQSKVDVSKAYSGCFHEYKFYNKGNAKYEIKTDDGYDDITGIPLLTFEGEPNTSQFCEVSAIVDIKGTFDQVTEINDSSGQMFRLYNASFKRLPDVAGLKYWISNHSEGINSNRVIAQSFINSNEFSDRYGENITNAKYVETLYINVLGRDYDQAGYDYWLGNLNAGTETRYELLLGFAESAENKALFTEMTGLG